MTDDGNEHERFTALYRRYHAPVLAYALRRVGPDDAHDVLAETFAAAWRNIAELPEEPLPWLYRAAGYRVANHWRSTSRRARLTARAAALPDASHPDLAGQIVESDRVRTALAQLSASDRDAIMLVCWEDLDHASAAYAAGCTPATFRVRVFRARRRLARLLDHPSETTEAAASADAVRCT